MAAEYTHPLSKLAPAPYTFAGLETTEDRVALNRYREANGFVYTTNMCGGSCDLCGQAIWNVYRFKGSDGTEFKLGSECMKKAQIPAKLLTAAQAETKKRAAAKRKAKAEVARKARQDANRADFERLVENLPGLVEAAREGLSGQPHPSAYFAEQGLTLADYADWVIEHPTLACLRLIEEHCSTYG
jgi:hypothetical protein